MCEHLNIVCQPEFDWCIDCGSLLLDSDKSWRKSNLLMQIEIIENISTEIKLMSCKLQNCGFNLSDILENDKI